MLYCCCFLVVGGIGGRGGVGCILPIGTELERRSIHAICKVTCSRTCSINMAFARAAFSGTKSVNQLSFWDGLTAVTQSVKGADLTSATSTADPLQERKLELSPCDSYIRPSCQDPSGRFRQPPDVWSGTPPSVEQVLHSMGLCYIVWVLFHVREAAGTHEGSTWC